MPKPNAILQNDLTNQYAELHYKVDGFKISGTNFGIKLQQYNLDEEGDQAALGFDVGTAPKDISLINGTIKFSYKYVGGAHTFRAVTDNDDSSWFVETQASPDTTIIEKLILREDFEGMVSFAADEETGKAAVPFGLSQVKKFLWVVEYNDETAENNTGSLLIDEMWSLVD
ncbi:hypothetical protein R83H12_02382 [Fibrobacteria bacterium R8-3-H12]